MEEGPEFPPHRYGARGQRDSLMEDGDVRQGNPVGFHDHDGYFFRRDELFSGPEDPGLYGYSGGRDLRSREEEKGSNDIYRYHLL